MIITIAVTILSESRAFKIRRKIKPSAVDAEMKKFFRKKSKKNKITKNDGIKNKLICKKLACIKVSG